MRLPIALAPAASRPFDVVTVGLNSIDLVAVVQHYPASNSKQRLESWSKRPGGQMATAAAVCARLGWRARYVGAFGSDDLAVMGRESLTAEGVDVSTAWDVPGATTQFAVIIVDAGTGVVEPASRSDDGRGAHRRCGRHVGPHAAGGLP